MSNNYLLSMPIKAMNISVKAKLAEINDNIQFETKGILYKKKYYDFRVSKIINNYELSESISKDSTYVIHINQIKNENIFISLIFKNKIECFILSENFLENAKNLMSYQHHKKCYQLHISYKYLVNNAKKVEVINVV